jgi:hypothetical protein
MTNSGMKTKIYSSIIGFGLIFCSLMIAFFLFIEDPTAANQASFAVGEAKAAPAENVPAPQYLHLADAKILPVAETLPEPIINPVFVSPAGELMAAEMQAVSSPAPVLEAVEKEAAKPEPVQAKAVAPLAAEKTEAAPAAAMETENQAAMPINVTRGTQAESVASSVSALDTFASKVVNGNAGQVVGVHVPERFSLRVAQQPANDPAYVQAQAGTLTQFALASNYGSLGLLAHNNLGGAKFSSLAAGMEVDVVLGDGSVRRYSISQVRHFQALSPRDPYSQFIDVDNNNGQLSSTDLFMQMYAGGGDRLVFQTCISANGDESWGRLFVIAVPM